MSLKRFSFSEIEGMATALLQSGMHPNRVRQALKAHGVSWSYQFMGQGAKEKLRRLRKAGMGLCSECRKDSYPLGSSVNVCRTCLEKKWATA